MRKTESQKIALCGVLGALSVVLLLVGAALQIGTYAAPMLAAFLLIPVLDEYGPKYALLLYATVSILSVLLVPELELAFFYVFVIGYYPVLRQKLARIKSTLLRWVIKFAVFNGATVLVYLLLFALLGPAILDELLADGVGMLAALLAAGNLSFWLCDRAVGALTRYYRLILKKKVKVMHEKQIHANWFAGAASSTPPNGPMQASASTTARQASFQRNNQKINDNRRQTCGTMKL